MTDEELRALGKELPYDRPDAGRREAVRSSLLVEAAEHTRAPRGRSWSLAGGGFVAGAAAAALLVVWLMRRDVRPPDVAHAQIEAVAQANFEREVTATTAGTDEVVRLHAGTLRLAVGALPKGDRVRVKTADAEVEGAGDYEVAVAGDEIREVKVRSGSARITVTGMQAVFLGAGESWTAPVVTARVEIGPGSQTEQATGHRKQDTGSEDEQGTGNRQQATGSAETAPETASAPTATATGTGTASGRRITPGTVAVAETAPASGTGMASGRRTTPGGTSGAPHDTTSNAGSQDSNAASRDTTSTGAAPDASHVATDPTHGGAPEAKKPDTKRAAIERYFEAGYALLRAGKADEAASELAAAAELDPDDPLANDARYFQAVALLKAKRPAEAEKALVAFLDHAKTSLRRGRASVMLGRLLADRGDRTSARAWFEAATIDPDADVVAAARAGLDALGK